MGFFKRTGRKILATIVNRVAQSSVSEIKDGRDSSEKLKRLCRQVASESIVLLRNENILPIKEEEIAVFGRCQFDYFYVGYGSGGDVKAPYKVSPILAFKERNAKLNQEVCSAYEKWIEKNPPYDGFWGFWPMNYDEMPVSKQLVQRAAKTSETAIVFIGRSAGEDRENKKKKGSWYLTNEEKRLLKLVTSSFQKVCVVINSGSIMDMSWMDKYPVGAVLYAWQGGQESGNGLVDVLYGTSPCGKLPDTIANIEDYPARSNFGKRKQSIYQEDIYVGYRYFETFERDKVRYPFGFGLSYTSFESKLLSVEEHGGKITVSVQIKNTGSYSGKEVVQVYYSAPQGRNGSPVKQLIAFQKTDLLTVGQEQVLTFSFGVSDMASYDEASHSFVLEKGTYSILLGTNVRDVNEIYSYTVESEITIKQTNSACVPQKTFKRLCNQNGKKSWEKIRLSPVDLRKRIQKHLPDPVVSTDKRHIKLIDVKEGRATLSEFIATLSLDELETLCRGSLDGMNAKNAPVGNAGTFGGTSGSLIEKGVPTISTNDGPSGIRLQAHTTLMPIGTAFSATFDTKLIETLLQEIGKEMRELRSHVYLAPGMNIHRDPLCGRNFEYFSEDPYLTAQMASAYVKGVQKAGVSATVKHFSCNNQETARLFTNSVVSERALREIYLKPFELCIKEAKPDCVMTSYNKLNGVYNCYNYDLSTTILRDEWGFDGIVMTDWWIRYRNSPNFKNVKRHAYRVQAQVDVFMPGSDMFGKYVHKSDGSILKSLNSKDGLTLGELQRSAENVLKLCIKYLDR